ncbi:MAG: Holliday junction resolvase RuvX [Pseudomonadota bacterium]
MTSVTPDPDAQQSQTVLGLDYGAKRIGVAVGETLAGSARPLSTLRAVNGKPNWPALGEIVQQWRPSVVVIGMPRAAHGETHTLQPAIERFARQVAGRFKLPTQFVDESLSSIAAEELQAANAEIDARAACIILQTYFSEILS